MLPEGIHGATFGGLYPLADLSPEAQVLTDQQIFPVVSRLFFIPAGSEPGGHVHLTPCTIYKAILLPFIGLYCIQGIPRLYWS